MRIYRAKGIVQVIFSNLVFLILACVPIARLVDSELQRGGVYQHEIDYLRIALISGMIWILSVAVTAFTHKTVICYDIHENIIDSEL